jgi:ribosome-associated toxin RatA of RatAB toxin-antitoxin module
MTSPQPANASKRRLRKRLIIPGILIAFVLLFVGWVYVRGTWADTEERNPKSPEDAPITQLYRDADGRVQVRCAVVIEARPGEVWQVVTDYPRHHEFVPFTEELTVVAQEDLRIHLQGTAQSSLLGKWPFEIHVTHEEDPIRRRYRAHWDEPSGELNSNRGSWTLSPTPEENTLVVYALEIEVERYPTFVIRNLLRDRLHKVLLGVRDEVQRRQGQ